MRLVVFHYHDRPGGVRQVISRGLPQLLPRLGGVSEVVLLLGEVTDPDWVQGLAASLGGVPLRTVVHREFGYRSGQPQILTEVPRRLLGKVLSGKNSLCWAHNLSVGRNLPLLRLLPEICQDAGARLWLHHHDWWWDGRWARWSDWRAAGVSGLEEALELSLPVGPNLRHWCVNQADLAWVQIRAGAAARWVGNPLPDFILPGKNEIFEAAAWLRRQSGGRRVWLAPVRALRRKNPAEAIFLAQQQTEPTCVITTGGPSSPAEVPAWHSLCAAAVRHQWPFVPAVLANQGARVFNPPRSPGLYSLPALLTAADAILMPSLQEGFGLPYLEAAALGKPLLARALPEVAANLSAFGCHLTATYTRLPVATAAFDFGAEQARLAARWPLLREQLPAELAAMAGPRISVRDEEIDFGSLTLEAQLEVLESGCRMDLPGLQPAVPLWPEDCREEAWADRFGEAGQYSVDPGGQKIRPPQGDLLPEVLRRFRDWQAHPLLWP